MTTKVFDPRVYALGEGPLWHPERGQLFWFDILGKRLLSRDGDEALEWSFEEHVSAAGWVDHDTLLIASETALFAFDLTTGTRTDVTALEADNAVTRSNDGRADPWGGFWIGTMGKAAERKAGAIYRFLGGELRQIVKDITISNAICFAPDKSHAYFTDTATRRIMKIALDFESGWPKAAPEIHIDLRPDEVNPDGAVTDAAGNLWVAEWGSARVSCYSPAGARIETLDVDASQTTCPAFGGPEFTDLYVTSAADGLSAAERDARPNSGAVFVKHGAGQGRAEPRVIL